MGTAKAGDPPHKRADYAPQRSPVLHGTSHMTIVESDGQVVAMTTSVESAFGAEIMAEGLPPQQHAHRFFLASGYCDGKPVANAAAPGKRPLSGHVAHHRVRQGQPVPLSVGSPGGPAIIDYVAQSLVAMLDGEMTPAPAIALPRQLNLNGRHPAGEGPGVDALAASADRHGP